MSLPDSVLEAMEHLRKCPQCRQKYESTIFEIEKHYRSTKNGN